MILMDSEYTHGSRVQNMHSLIRFASALGVRPQARRNAFRGEDLAIWVAANRAPIVSKAQRARGERLRYALEASTAIWSWTSASKVKGVQFNRRRTGDRRLYTYSSPSVQPPGTRAMDDGDRAAYTVWSDCPPYCCHPTGRCERWQSARRETSTAESTHVYRHIDALGTFNRSSITCDATKDPFLAGPKSNDQCERPDQRLTAYIGTGVGLDVEPIRSDPLFHTR
jgi:hypothetical protein